MTLEHERTGDTSSHETTSWTPAINLKPHHVFLDEFKNAIAPKFRIYPIHRLPIGVLKFPLDVVDHWKHWDRDWWYTHDTYGSPFRQSPDEQPAMDANLKQRREGMKEVGKLSDSDVAHLDLPKDFICNACPVGTHCTATNMVMLGKTDLFKRETRNLEVIHEKLLSKNYTEGTDFIFKPTWSELMDYNGQELWNSRDEPTPTLVRFNSMLLKVGALRGIIHGLKLPPRV